MGLLVPYDPRKPHAFTGADHAFGLASFLCPVCAQPLFGEDGAYGDPCEHVLLTFDDTGAIRYRDDAIRRMVVQAQEAVCGAGGDAMEALREDLGPNVIFFELHDQPPGQAEPHFVTFVVDLAGSAPSGGVPELH